MRAVLVVSLAVMLIAAAVDAGGGYKPKRRPPVRRARLGVDVDSSCFEKHFGGSEEKVRQRLTGEFLPQMNAAWTPGTGIHWVLGPLEVRKTAESDPYDGTNDAGEIYGRFRRLWNKKRGRSESFQKAILFVGKGIGYGGLGGGRYALVSGVWGAWAHELSHCFGNGHGARGCLEHGTMSNRMQERLFRLPVKFDKRFSDTEVAQALAHMGTDFRAYPILKEFDEPVAPYARLDVTVCDVARSEAYVDIHVLGNDYDVNGDTLRIAAFDATSRYGGKVERVSRGKALDLLRYTPSRPVAMPDCFTYTIRDPKGLESRGNVLVQVRAPFDPNVGYEICCREGEGRRALCSRDGTSLVAGKSGDPADAPGILWKIVEIRQGLFRIEHARWPNALTVSKGGRGYTVALAPYKGSRMQQWIAVPTKIGALFRLRLKGSRYVLTGVGDSNGGGPPFRMLPERRRAGKDGRLEQEWGLVPAAPAR